MNAAFREQTECVVCAGTTRPLLDLGCQPPANALLSDPAQSFEAYPLGLAVCPRCAHGQLTHFVRPEYLFQDYLYASGTSGTLAGYFAWFAKELARCMRPAARVLEVASNDGSHLAHLSGQGFDVTGIDPARNLTALAASAGHKVLTGFFPDTRPEGRFDAIIAMNVLAHTPTPFHFLKGVAESLAPGGMAVIQTSQALMLGNGEFDTIYHEHYSFFTVASMQALAKRAGLRIDRVQLVSIHGTSLLFVLRHADDVATTPAFARTPPFAVQWLDPRPAYLDVHFAGAEADATYAKFADKARAAMVSVAGCVGHHRGKGRPLALVGVAAKALTFVRAAGIEPDLYLDEAPLKVGRLVPGARTRIEPLSTVSALKGHTLFLIGAWNFADELVRKVRSFKPASGSTFLVHFPELREIA